MNKLLFALSAFALCATTQAGDVTLTNTFSANQPARASEVNQNFTDVKTAVDDNNSRITTVEGIVPGKQNRVSGACGAEQSIQSIKEDGTVICEADNDSGGTVTSVTAGAGLINSGTDNDPVIKRDSGQAAFPGSSYRVHRTSSAVCQIEPDFHRAHILVNGDSCSLQAPALLPDGATLTSLSCTFQTDSISIISFSLLATVLATDTTNIVISIPGSTPGNTSLQSKSNTNVISPADALVNNAERVYLLNAFVNNFVPTSEAVVINSACTIGYTF